MCIFTLVCCNMGQGLSLVYVFSFWRVGRAVGSSERVMVAPAFRFRGFFSLLCLLPDIFDSTHQHTSTSTIHLKPLSRRLFGKESAWDGDWAAKWCCSYEVAMKLWLCSGVAKE